MKLKLSNHDDEYYDDEYEQDDYDNEDYDDEDYDDDEYDDEDYDDDDEDYEDEAWYQKKPVIYGAFIGGALLLIVIASMIFGGSSPKTTFLKRLASRAEAEKVSMSYTLKFDEIDAPKEYSAYTDVLTDMTLTCTVQGTKDKMYVSAETKGLEDFMGQEMEYNAYILKDKAYVNAEAVLGSYASEYKGYYVDIDILQGKDFYKNSKKEANAEKQQKEVTEILTKYLTDLDEEKFESDDKGDVILTLNKKDIGKLTKKMLEASVETAKGDTKKELKKALKTFDSEWKKSTDDIEKMTLKISMGESTNDSKIKVTFAMDEFSGSGSITTKEIKYKEPKKPKKLVEKKDLVQIGLLDESELEAEETDTDTTEESKEATEESKDSDKSEETTEAKTEDKDDTTSAVDVKGSENQDSPAIAELREYLTNDDDGFTDEDQKTIEKYQRIEEITGKSTKS